ncbi:MAG: transposase [Planctomycetaceae bacterium]|jgi:hypothetical protein|nr:transposase [Planctomycetaceae bacterium]
MNILALHSKGVTAAKVSKLTNASKRTVYHVLHTYSKRRFGSGLSVRQMQTPKRTRTIRRRHYQRFDPTSCRIARRGKLKNRKIDGAQTKSGTRRRLSKKKGCKLLQAIGVPAKANLEEQKTFLETNLNPIIEAAKKWGCILYFLDSCHPVQGAFLTYFGCFIRCVLPTSSGRKRYNILGAYNPIAHTMEWITNTTYINSLVVCEMLHKLSALHKGIPIKIVLDNARYQRCKLVTNLAAELGIELVFLPPYSPNLIERY